MTFCPWCDAEVSGRFPTRCPECDAEFAHEADGDSEGWHAYVSLTKPGRPDMDQRLPAEPTKPEACLCLACDSLRAARSAPRQILYGDSYRPAWHVPLTPEHDALKRAISAVEHAHPRESIERLTNPAMTKRWEELTV